MKERILTKSQSEIEPRTCNLCQACENIDATLTVIGLLLSWKMQESHFNGCAFDWFPLCSKLILTACDWTNTNQRETAIKS